MLLISYRPYSYRFRFNKEAQSNSLLVNKVKVEAELEAYIKSLKTTILTTPISHAKTQAINYSCVDSFIHFATMQVASNTQSSAESTTITYNSTKFISNFAE